MNATESRKAEQSIMKLFQSKGFSQDDAVKILCSFDSMNLRDLLYMQGAIAVQIESRVFYGDKTER